MGPANKAAATGTARTAGANRKLQTFAMALSSNRQVDLYHSVVAIRWAVYLGLFVVALVMVHVAYR